jgi:hypothetical protein
VFLYVEKRLNLKQLGRKFKMSHATVARHLKRLGIDRRHEREKGLKNPNWRGGINQNSKTGRISVKMDWHPRARGNGYVNQAIVVWETVHGKSLPPGYIVHHIDENPGNDNPSNLRDMTRGDHQKLHHKGKKHTAEQKKIWSDLRKKWWDSPRGVEEKKRRSLCA